MKEKYMFVIKEDFPNALSVTMENGWITVWLPTCRVKFK